MNDFYQVIGNVGFPIAVTAFLLLRLEKKLDELNVSLKQLMEILIERKV